MFRIFTYSFLLCCVLLTELMSQPNPPEENSSSDESFLQAFDNFRSNSGIGIEFVYKGEVFSDIAGGNDRKSVYLDNIDLVFNLNLEELFNWKGAVIKTHFLGNHGSDPSEYAGASQGISNIAAFETWKLYQFWIEQSFFDNKFSLLAGLYDLNSEFDSRQTSAIFINPSHGIGADYALTGLNGPSIFPYTSLAIRAKYNFSPSWDIKAAVFDGIPGDLNHPHGTHVRFNEEDGLLISTELTHKSESEELNHGYFKYSIGGWYYTSEFEKLSTLTADVNPVMQTGNYGFYASAEKFLLQEAEGSNEGLAGFLRLGYADNSVNQVNAYLGAGLQYTGLIPGRDEDVLGIALATANNSSSYISLMASENIHADRFEHILELTYILNLSGWLSIQPDLQYVINPAGCQHSDYSLVYGTRLQLAL